MTGLNGMVARIVWRAPVITAAAMTVSVLAGCTFGDVPYEAAQPGVGPWFDDNCVPAACMFECCDGWNYSPKPLLRGGAVSGPACDTVKQKNFAYAEYVALMKSELNLCPSDFAALESGYCHVVQPPDVVKEFSSDGQPMYAGLSFLVCPPRGQPAAHPLEDVEFIYPE